MYAQTLSIDLGASYTKVAYRTECTPKHGEVWNANAKVLILDKSSLIPSVAVFTGDRKQPWFFGQDAANLTVSSSDRKVFLNWKANLFRPGNDELTVEAVIVAGNFFSWLRDQIELAQIDISRVETRVAMPSFANYDEKAALLAKCMELCGWNSPKILKATEPHANVIGLLSGGKNIAGRNMNNETLLQYNKMFGQSIYIKAARNAVLNQGNPLAKIMVLDIGAFTTDIATLTFDTRSEDDGLFSIKHESHAVGVINELDRPLLKSIGDRYGFEWQDFSFAESERRKQTLYAGQTQALLLKTFKGDIGGAADASLLDAHLDKFSNQIWSKIELFIKDNLPNMVFLTGGGTLIKPVSERLKNNFRDAKILVTHDASKGETIGTENWRTWDATGENLVRLATAVGGASVILQAGGELKADRIVEPIRLPQPEDAYMGCRFCKGVNKDCCYCSGKGYYRKS